MTAASATSAPWAVAAVAAAVLAVGLLSFVSPRRRGRGVFTGRRLFLRAFGWISAAASALFWSFASGGEAGWVHWLICLSLAGPLVVAARYAAESRRRGAVT